MKTQVTRIIDGVKRTITVNPKYAGTSRKPVNVESSARKFIVGGLLWPDDIPRPRKTTNRGLGQRRKARK